MAPSSQRLEPPQNPGRFTIRQRAADRLSKEIAAMDDAYGAPLSRRFLSVDPVDIAGAERLNLFKLADWAKEVIEQGAC